MGRIGLITSFSRVQEVLQINISMQDYSLSCKIFDARGVIHVFTFIKCTDKDFHHSGGTYV